MKEERDSLDTIFNSLENRVELIQTIQTKEVRKFTYRNIHIVQITVLINWLKIIWLIFHRIYVCVYEFCCVHSFHMVVSAIQAVSWKKILIILQSCMILICGRWIIYHGSTYLFTILEMIQRNHLSFFFIFNIVSIIFAWSLLNRTLIVARLETASQLCWPSTSVADDSISCRQKLVGFAETLITLVHTFSQAGWRNLKSTLSKRAKATKHCWRGLSGSRTLPMPTRTWCWRLRKPRRTDPKRLRWSWMTIENQTKRT